MAAPAPAAGWFGGFPDAQSGQGAVADSVGRRRGALSAARQRRLQRRVAPGIGGALYLAYAGSLVVRNSSSNNSIVTRTTTAAVAAISTASNRGEPRRLLLRDARGRGYLLQSVHLGADRARRHRLVLSARRAPAAALRPVSAPVEGWTWRSGRPHRQEPPPLALPPPR